jgi:hypothetical protein
MAKVKKDTADFSEEIKIKVLLWSYRHCCLCGKQCGTKIEVHHIVPKSKGGTGDPDNAIPLCFDCHAEVAAYQCEHPTGTKFSKKELKARREQIYEEHTRHLVPPLDYKITQQLPFGNKKRIFPDVGLTVVNLSDYLKARVFFRLNVILNNGKSEVIEDDYYNGTKPWHMNPRLIASGHFDIPQWARQRGERLEIRTLCTISDIHEREHELLPVGWVYMWDKNKWYFEP